MKRLFSIIFSLALVFSFSPLHSIVKAEENTAKTTVEKPNQPTTPEVTPSDTNDSQAGQKSNTTTTEENKGTTNNQEQPPTPTPEDQKSDDTSNQTPVSDVKMEVHRQFSDNGYLITATLKDVSSADGEWTFYVDGKKVSSKKNKKTSATYDLNVVNDLEKDGETKAYNIKVTYEGIVDQKDVKVEETHSIPDLKFEYTQVGDKDKFTGTIHPAKEAVGDWAILISDENGEEVIDMFSKENFKGTSFSHTFSGLKKGKYLVSIMFAGKVDGEDTGNVKYMLLEVTDEGKGGEIKPPPADYKPSKPVDKGTVDKIIKNTKKGGPMPKTATSNPTGMVAGVVLSLLGVVLLGYRRFANQK